jgi:hypothetical protein
VQTTSRLHVRAHSVVTAQLSATRSAAFVAARRWAQTNWPFFSGKTDQTRADMDSPISKILDIDHEPLVARLRFLISSGLPADQ